MRKCFMHIGFVVALSGILLSFISCDRQIAPGSGTSDVQLNIDLSGNLDVEETPWTKAEGDYVDASKHEGVRTLRIIVTSGAPESRTILYNNKVTGLENISTYTTTIENLPHEALTFYAIANEESLSMTYDNNTITDNLANNHKLLFMDVADPKHFPARGPDIVDNGLPMSGYTAVTLTGDKSVTIDLYRSVVKLALVVENATKSDVTLRKVSFGEFFGDRYYMFRDLALDVPDGIQYSDMIYDNLEIVIPGVADDGSSDSFTDTLTAYFYPTHPQFDGNNNSPFTIGFETGSPDSPYVYEPQVFAPNTAFFVRNTQVNLHARITTTVGIELSFEVAPWTVTPWEEYNQDVPSFD